MDSMCIIMKMEPPTCLFQILPLDLSRAISTRVDTHSMSLIENIIPSEVSLAEESDFYWFERIRCLTGEHHLEYSDSDDWKLLCSKVRENLSAHEKITAFQRAIVLADDVDLFKKHMGSTACSVLG